FIAGRLITFAFSPLELPSVVFFFPAATTATYTLSLHDALPIYSPADCVAARGPPPAAPPRPTHYRSLRRLTARSRLSRRAQRRPAPARRSRCAAHANVGCRLPARSARRQPAPAASPRRACAADGTRFGCWSSRDARPNRGARRRPRAAVPFYGAESAR